MGKRRPREQLMKRLAVARSPRARRYRCARTTVKAWVLNPTKRQTAETPPFCRFTPRDEGRLSRRAVCVPAAAPGRPNAAANPGFAPWSVAGGAVRAEREKSAKGYAPSRDPSNVAAEPVPSVAEGAATYKTGNLAKIASQEMQIARHTLSSNFPRIPNKTNDWCPHKVT